MSERGGSQKKKTRVAAVTHAMAITCEFDAECVRLQFMEVHALNVFISWHFELVRNWCLGNGAGVWRNTPAGHKT